MSETKRVVSTRWLILYPLLFALTITGIVVLWGSVPDPMPNIIASGWQQDQTVLVDKSVKQLLPGIISQLTIVVLFTAANFLVKVANPIHIPVPKNLTPEEEARRRYYGSAVLVVLGVITITVLGIIQITVLMATFGS